MSKLYRGIFVGEWLVTVNGQPLNPRLDLVNHSPTGFSWGYLGSGPAQLALALLADILGDDQEALRLYQLFKAEWVTRLGYNANWSAWDTEILTVIDQLRKEKI